MAGRLLVSPFDDHGCHHSTGRADDPRTPDHHLALTPPCATSDHSAAARLCTRHWRWSRQPHNAL
ncbi:hypothetical protein U9M48_029553 [Paspalum notatum var. saurae]|uniref:Uncharacterized protein n=1 Tax=Paspalum notatum var. saurae TaxID=547442 RepID=A0AAQ3X2T4_PASNO